MCKNISQEKKCIRMQEHCFLAMDKILTIQEFCENLNIIEQVHSRKEIEKV